MTICLWIGLFYLIMREADQFAIIPKNRRSDLLRDTEKYMLHALSRNRRKHVSIHVGMDGLLQVTENTDHPDHPCQISYTILPPR
jgi:formamidopyrimidine-DNA glycosylase